MASKEGSVKVRLVVVVILTAADLIACTPASRKVGSLGEWREVSPPYKYASLLRIPSMRNCLAVLVDLKWALTTGHCAEYRSGDVIVAGDHTLNKIEYEEQIVGIKHWITEQDARTPPSERVYNMGLLELKPGVTLTDHVQTANLPGFALDLSSGSATTVGWIQSGNLELEDRELMLRELQFPLVPLTNCKRERNGTEVVEVQGEMQICAGGGPGHGSCQGIPGAPLYVEVDGKQVLVGFQEECEEYNGKSRLHRTYVKVFPFIPWIKYVTGLECLDGEMK